MQNADFWHISWIAGTIFIVAALFMFLIVIFYFDEGDNGDQKKNAK